MDAISKITGRPPVTTSRSASESVSDLSGEKKYALGRELGRGGMGIVYQVYDRDIRRQVAMKILPADADEEKRVRFVEEAQVTGQLEHPNIIPIYDLGIDESGRLFFTMKFLHGKTLGEIFDRIRLDPACESKYPLPALIHALVHACDAVSFAHERGVVHRDLKPGNLMIGDYGEVYVMDWGLAKVHAARSGHSPSPPPPPPPLPAAEPAAAEMVESYRHDSSLYISVDGMVVGTPAYMSPEQARGDIHCIDERTDIYGLGAILYEILTLLPPVEGKDDNAYIRNAMAGRIIPPAERVPHRNIPPALARIAMKALAYDPKQRYQSARELKADLTAFLYDYHNRQAGGIFRLCRTRAGRALFVLVAVAGYLFALLLLASMRNW